MILAFNARMPIKVSSDIRVLDQEEFHALDRKIMGIVFEVHNEFGRLLNEDLFKHEIAARCEARGLLPSEREVLIRVTHESFRKDYFMDLLIGHGVMLEAKAAENLTPTHRSQALNYLFLTGMNHGRLVNLRSARVQHEFVSTRLTPALRRRFTIVDDSWRCLDERSELLRRTLIALLEDWGAFLEGSLYREAVVHFFGGAAVVDQDVKVFSGSRCLGTQKLHLLDERTAFTVTTVATGAENMREHLERLLLHTRLEFLQWINLNHHQVELVTLGKTKSWKTKS